MKRASIEIECVGIVSSMSIQSSSAFTFLPKIYDVSLPTSKTVSRQLLFVIPIERDLPKREREQPRRGKRGIIGHRTRATKRTFKSHSGLYPSERCDLEHPPSRKLPSPKSISSARRMSQRVDGLD